MRVIIEVN